MAHLNSEYRNKEGPTNVLTFSQWEGAPGFPEKNLLGDVVICADRAETDADELGYSLDEMLLYLLLHGIVHLKGYTHDEIPEAREMEQKVEDLFQRLMD